MLKVEMEKSLIEYTSRKLAEMPEIYMAGYTVGEAYSKGMLSAMKDMITDTLPGMLTSDGIYMEQHGLIPQQMYTYGAYSMGLPYVPYDDYVARLHQGERVLTAQEARQYPGSGEAQAVITGNNFYVREETDIQKVGKEIASEILKLSSIGRS
jgi:hypothetical protein